MTVVAVAERALEHALGRFECTILLTAHVVCAPCGMKDREAVSPLPIAVASSRARLKIETVREWL